MDEQNFLEDQLVIITKQTLDVFLQQDNPADLIGLYTFYYYTAKWQKTNQIRCTTSYAANGLHMGEQKIRTLKKQLIELGLIEDVAVRNNLNQIEGHYIRMKYIFRQDTTAGQVPTLAKNHSVENEDCEKSHTCKKPQCGKSHSVENCKTNALSDNKENALSDSNLNALNTNIGAGKKQTKKTAKEKPDYTAILSKIEDTELQATYFEFIKMRELIKKPLTNRALELLISKTEKLAPRNIAMQKAILEQSIMNNWQGVFPLKDESRFMAGGQASSYAGGNEDTDNVFLQLLRQEQAVNGG